MPHVNGCFEQYYEGRRAVCAGVAQVIGWFERFAATRMREWRTQHVATEPDGTQVVQLGASFTPYVQLEPQGILARMAAGWAAANCQPSLTYMNVSYEYIVRFHLRPLGPAQTEIAYTTIEQVDRGRRLQGRIGNSFEPPAMPSGFGNVGAELLAFVAQHAPAGAEARR